MILAVDAAILTLYSAVLTITVNCALYQGSTHRFQEWKISMR